MKLFKFETTGGDIIAINVDKIIFVKKCNIDQTYIYMVDGQILSVNEEFESVFSKLYPYSEN